MFFVVLCEFVGKMVANLVSALGSVSLQKSGEEQRQCLKPGAAAPVQELSPLSQRASGGAPQWDCSHVAADSTTASETQVAGFSFCFEPAAVKIAEPLR